MFVSAMSHSFISPNITIIIIVPFIQFDLVQKVGKVRTDKHIMTKIRSPYFHQTKSD